MPQSWLSDVKVVLVLTPTVQHKARDGGCSSDTKCAISPKRVPPIITRRVRENRSQDVVADSLSERRVEITARPGGDSRLVGFGFFGDDVGGNGICHPVLRENRMSRIQC